MRNWGLPVAILGLTGTLLMVMLLNHYTVKSLRNQRDGAIQAARQWERASKGWEEVAGKWKAVAEGRGVSPESKQLKWRHQPDISQPPAISILRMNDLPLKITFNGEKGMVLQIHGDGRVEAGKSYKPNDGARQLLRSLSRLWPQYLCDRSSVLP